MLDNVKVVKQGGGEEVYVGQIDGCLYTKNIVRGSIDNPITRGVAIVGFSNCPNLESIETYCLQATAYGMFTHAKNINLKRVVAVNLQGFGVGADIFSGSNELETVQLGALGYKAYGANKWDSRLFRGCTANAIVTIYVDRNDYQTYMEAAPWGGANITIVYRDYLTGEVIEI